MSNSVPPPDPPGPSEQLQDAFQGLSVKSKKKRSVRAHHLDYSLPNSSSNLAGLNSIPATPPVSTPQFATQLNTPRANTPSIPGPSTGGIPTPIPVASTPVQGNENSVNVDSMSGEESLSISYQRHKDQLEYMSVVDEHNAACKPFLTFENVVSPTGGTQFQTVDQGTGSSKFIRSTMYNIPETEQLRLASKLPVSVTIRPFAPLLDSEDPIPEVDMRELGKGFVDADDVGPIRCRRCRTYMNPAIQHTHGDKFTCNICLFPNNYVPSDYSAMMNPSTNQRVDVGLRPELHRGVYDILVPPLYNVGGPEKAPSSLHHVFLIDITVESIKKNLPMVVADAIRLVLYSEQTCEDDEPVLESNRKFAIILFDKRMHFYNLSKELDSTQITISADLDDPFIPFFDGLFADPEQSRIAIEDALNNLELLCSEDSLMADDEPCFSVALRTALLCLSEVGGGKITAVLSSLPSWGPGGLKFKDNKLSGAAFSPEVQKKIYSADNNYYRLLAKDFLKQNVGLDTLVVSQVPVDLSNIGWLCSTTGGSVFRWSNFNFERDVREFTGRFAGSVLKTKAYQGQLKLRVSNGLQVAQYYGTSDSVAETSVVGMGSQDPVLPVVSEDHSYTILLEYDGKLSTSNDCHFQAAVLHTDEKGQRKVRVINLVLAVSERLDDIFTFVDQDAVVTTIVRDTLSFVTKQTFKDLRESVNAKLVEIFTQYRAKSELGHHSKSTLTNRLLMPDSLARLPLYMISFLKSIALRESTLLSADARLEDIYQMLNMPVERLMYHLYPALVELHSLYPYEGTIPSPNSNPLNFVYLPRYKDLSLSQLEDGIYVMCDGKRVLVWIRPNTNPLLIKDLFGENIESIQQINVLDDELPDLPTSISSQVRNLIKFFNSQINGLNSVGAAGIQIIREGIDGSDIFFKEHLVEDGSKLAMTTHNSSYPDFLTRLHKAIREKLDNDKSYTKVKKSINSAEKPESLAQRYINF